MHFHTLTLKLERFNASFKISDDKILIVTCWVKTANLSYQQEFKVPYIELEDLETIIVPLSIENHGKFPIAKSSS